MIISNVHHEENLVSRFDKSDVGAITWMEMAFLSFQLCNSLGGLSLEIELGSRCFHLEKQTLMQRLGKICRDVRTTQNKSDHKKICHLNPHNRMDLNMSILQGNKKTWATYPFLFFLGWELHGVICRGKTIYWRSEVTAVWVESKTCNSFVQQMFVFGCVPM